MIQKLNTVWRIVLNYIYYTARPQSINPIHLLRQVREGFSVQKVRRKYPDLYKEICGLIANVNIKKQIADCKKCHNKSNFSKISLPYASKLLFYEVASMGITTRFRT